MKIMKATGIIRRTDDLGRVVIPKEIRRTLKIREGDPLEIFVEKDCVCFQKYSPLGSMDDETLRIALAMAKNSGLRPIAIYDRDVKLRGLKDFPLYAPDEWEQERKPFAYNNTYGVYPIITDGELMGYVVCDWRNMGAEMMMIARYLSVAVGD